MTHPPVRPGLERLNAFIRAEQERLKTGRLTRERAKKAAREKRRRARLKAAALTTPTDGSSA